MKTEEINIRDPYILLHEGVYYLYGTRSETCWEKAEGFDCYKSEDLMNWEGPIEIFHRAEDFWADRKFWAPECYFHQEKFYFVTTLGAENRKSGIQILVSDNPEGPFEPLTGDVVTPRDWNCIDGTLYWENDEPYLVFSHAFEDEPEGYVCYMPLTKDLSVAIEEPKKMTSAVDAPWAVPVPFAKQEFGMDGDIYFTDGPCLHRLSDGKLLMLWSSWGEKGYTVGMAYSDNGKINGKWKHVEEPLFPGNGGHGMVFKDKKGKQFYTLHYPNDKYKEHPIFLEVVEENGALALNGYWP